MNTAKGFNSYYVTRDTHKIEHISIKKPQRKSLWYKLKPWVLAIGLIIIMGLVGGFE